MVDNGKIDAAYICVPPFAHGPPEKELMRRGIPFFVEKPLAVDQATADEIADQVETRGVVTAVGYHWRYLDVLSRAQKLLSDSQPRLILGYWLSNTPPPPWWVRTRQSGGQFVEQATHIFDLARILVGEVTRVSAAGSRLDRAAFPQCDILDAAVCVLTFASGAYGVMATTCLLRHTHRVGLHLFADDLAIEVATKGPGGTEPFELRWDTGTGPQIERPVKDPIVREDRDFIDAVQGRGNHIKVPYTEALKTHRLTTAAARAATEGCSIELTSTES
jgi:predicted dehydrogenase